MFFEGRASRIAYVICAASVIACGGEARTTATPAATIQLRDDAGFVVALPRPARRIVSLIPSATETLIALGALPQLVGRTRYDTARALAALPSMGGGIDASVEAMVSLHPDLVITWESDKRQEARQKLTSLGIPVFILRTEDTTDIFRGIASLGQLSGHDSAARAISATMRATLDTVRRSVASRPAPSVFYVVFNDPPMTAGPHTFLGQLIPLAGGVSVFADAAKDWPNVAMEEIVKRDPDVLVVPVGEFSTNALARLRDLPGWRDMRAVRSGHVIAVPADIMSRPGPSIAQAARILARALHPEVAQP